MEKIGTKIVESSFGKRLEFDVYPCNCKVGDTVWFDDGIPDEDGTITDHSYMQGKVIEIEPDKWWIFDNGEKELGFVTIEVEDDEQFAGQRFLVAFKDIIYQQPTDPQSANRTDTHAMDNEVKDLITIKPVVCDYGLYYNDQLIHVFNSHFNARLVKDIMETDMQWPNASTPYSMDHYARFMEKDTKH